MPQTNDLRAPCLPCGQQLGPGEAAGSPCWTNQGAGTHHLHALHQGQPHGLVPAQRHHAGRGLRGGLEKGDHGLHPHATGLEMRVTEVRDKVRGRGTMHPRLAPGCAEA